MRLSMRGGGICAVIVLHITSGGRDPVSLVRRLGNQVPVVTDSGFLDPYSWTGLGGFASSEGGLEDAEGSFRSTRKSRRGSPDDSPCHLVYPSSSRYK